MKTVLLGLLLLNSSVQASSFQEYCSNGMGTVKLARGHMVNEISVTERVKTDWAFADHKVILNDPAVAVLEEKQLEQHEDRVCEGKWGVAYWRNVTYKKIQILNPDGSLFAPNILGVSKDQSTVEASVICEEQGNSEFMCAEEDGQ